MIIRTWSASILFCCFVACSMERETAPPAGFEQTFGGPGTEVGNSLLELPDGGYLIVGYSSSFGAGDDDVYLVRTDGRGTTLWTKTHGGPGNDLGWDILPTASGGFVITGFTNSEGAGGDDILLLATDDKGDLLWSHTFGGEAGERSWALESTEDGGYVITGQTESWGAGDWDVYIVRTDGAGETVWTQTVGGPGVDRVFDGVRTDDGGFAFAGMSREEPDSDLDAYLVKLDADGKVVWERRYGGAEDDIGHGLLAIDDGGFLVTGYGRSFGAGGNDVYLIRTDPEGEVLWQREIGGPSDDRAMMSAADGKTGFVTIGYSDWDATLYGTREDGSLVWSETFESAGQDRGVMVQRSTDGGYVFTGRLGAADDDSSDLFLFKRFLP
jgi:hypothetical protein